MFNVACKICEPYGLPTGMKQGSYGWELIEAVFAIYFLAMIGHKVMHASTGKGTPTILKVADRTSAPCGSG